MIAPMVVVIDEPANAGLKITRQVVVFQEDAVLERLIVNRRSNLTLDRRPILTLLSAEYGR
jgi:hypothetical protein